MNGRIDVESAVGAGTSFRFFTELPSIAAPTSKAVSDYSLASPRRILVADDNAINQLVIEGLLTADGHAVTLVSDGLQAVAAVGRETFDLVFMDMQMPTLDGIGATRRIRALLAPACDVPIIALTANATTEHMDMCRAAGMNDYLSKPIDRNALRRAIANRSTLPTPRPTRTSHPNEPDCEHLRELFNGDLGAVAALLTSAIDLIAADLVGLQASVERGDIAAVAQHANRLIGTSGTLRCTALTAASRELVHAARELPTALDSELVVRLGEAATMALSAISRCREALTAGSDARRVTGDSTSVRVLGISSEAGGTVGA